MPATSQRIRRILLTARILLALVTAYCVYQLYSIHNYGRHDTGEQADCAIVLGAAAYHNKPSPVFEQRIRHAIELYRAGRVKKLLLTGGFGKNAAFAESEVARTYALEAGLPSADILLETSSDKTSENLTEAARVMQSSGLTSAIIVSDPWHLKRACTMARDTDIIATPSATPTTLFKSFGAQTKFLFSEFYNLHHYYLFHE